MAYAAVASLLQTVDLLLNYHEPSISLQFKNQVISIHQHTSSLRSFIEDSPNRANNWEETIRKVTNKAEDIIELLLSDSLLKSTVRSSKSEFEKGKCEVRYGLDELEEVIEEIESIANKVKLGRRIEIADGSDDELMEIVSRIREGSSSLEKIAICGSGGMGKTTLAGNAYNHQLIVEHFDIRAWSLVYNHGVRRRIALNLLRSMNKLNAQSESDSEDELIQSVSRNFGGKRYLIVLDDLWSPEALDWLKLMLPDIRNGSRIVFTTRSLELAKSADHIHEMSLLDDDQSWDLLREKIFKGDPCPFQLESMGKTIARSCGGHLLSIEVISGILTADQSEAAWEDVSENINIACEDVGGETMQVLSLSYTYLPHHLRPCFLYLGIFPEKEEIHVSKLVKLWAAEGFLNQSGFKSFEDTGKEHVKDLVRRKLVSVYKRKSNGSIKSIIIHDLMRDLCLRQAYIDNFISNHVGRLQCCRRVSSSTCGDEFLEAFYGSTVRTIMLPFEGGRQYNIVRCLIGDVRLLRILDLSNANNYVLPIYVFELFHLRYLAFHCEFRISEAISNLKNLQTLIIYPDEKNCMFRTLPKGIWRIPQLRHLFVFPLKLPRRIGPITALENLQMLSGLENFVCSRNNLKMIQNVIKLFVYFTHYGDVVEDYEIDNLIYLQKLEILKIKMDWSVVEQHKMSLAFPTTLKKLNLHGFAFPWEDMQIVASLPNLQVLKLRNHACSGERWETSEGGFSQLTFLLIEKSDLEHWISESSHFPKLKHLVLRECLNLREVQNSVGGISTLKLIEADYSNWSLLVSLKQIQEDRQSMGNSPFKLVLGEGGNKHLLKS